MTGLFDVPSCDKCRNPAIHHQVYSGRMMCGAHLAESVRKKASKALREQLYLTKGEHTTILVAISGGKDSAVLLERIHENLGKRRDVTIVGGCVDEGIEGYRPPSLECARDLCEELGIRFETVSYPELGFTNQHHSQTHYGRDQEKIGKVSAINKFNVDQYAYMVRKMHALKEGEGTLLDNCIMMWGSGLEDGNKHRRENLPFILAGKGGGSLKTGRFLTGVKGNQGDLLTTLLSCVGVPLDRPMGIATKQISQLKA